MKTDKLENLRLNCKIHRSEIAAICSDYKCENNGLCIKCISESNSCIRKNNHISISISEFINQFFNDELETLKKDFSQSIELSNSLNYLSKTDEIIKHFRNSLDEIYKTINNQYTITLAKINQLYEEFNKNFVKLATDMEKQLAESLELLNREFNYFYLGEYNYNKLREKLSKMPIETFNTTISMIKKTFNSIKNKSYFRYEEEVSSLININSNIVNKYINSFREFENQFEVNHELLKNSLKDEIFLPIEYNKQPIENFKVIYDDLIDFSSNSNFLDKKFTVFQHSNGETILAYPTSQNTIKLEYFDKLINHEEINDSLIAKSFSLNHNSRDEYLFFNLQYHGGKVLDMKYYRHMIKDEVKDYFISSSEDKTLKIWDITSINKNIKSVNEYYKSNLVKTLIGHENRISTFILFNDQLSKNTLYIISIGYGDRIKVWDLNKANFIRDFETISNYDTLAYAYTNLQTKKNILLTANNNFSIRVWDFDKGTVTQTIKYPVSKIISLIPLDDSYGGWLIIDENSKCGYLNDEYKFFPSEIETYMTNRVGCIKHDKKSVFIYCKNGIIYEYDIYKKKIVSRLDISDKPISFAMKYDHHTKKNLIIIHSIDQRLKILSL